MPKLKIKKMMLAGVALSLLALSPAIAADMPSRPLPMPKAPVFVPFFSWTGVYVGINGGYGFGDSDWTNSLGVSSGGFSLDGWTVGGTLGYNWQMGSAVFGLETDFAWTDFKGETSNNCFFSCATSNHWLGTSRVRLGYAFDRFMPYITGGVAYGDVRAHEAGLKVLSEARVGWTLGGGVEWAFFPNWSAKLEYLYVDLGSVTCPAVTACLLQTDIDFTTNIVRGGINYKF